MSEPTPPPFDSRALGELVLSRLTEIEHLRSPERTNEIKRGLDWQGAISADNARVERLTHNLDLYARLADTAARAEHNDILTRQQVHHRRDRDSDEF